MYSNDRMRERLLRRWKLEQERQRRWNFHSAKPITTNVIAVDFVARKLKGKL